MSAICTSDFIRHVYRSFLLMGCYRTPKQLFSNQFAVYLVKSGAEAHVAERVGTGTNQGEGGRSRSGRIVETRPPERQPFAVIPHPNIVVSISCNSAVWEYPQCY